MSVEAVQRKNGRVWRVRWRDANGRARSRVIGNQADAKLFEADLVRRQRMGQLARIDDGKQTLARLAETWFSAYALPNLAPNTLSTYTYLWDAHVAPRLCHYRLCDLTVQVVAQFRADLHAAGIGDAAIRKTLVLLQSVVQHAVEWEWLSRNVVAAVPKPPARRQRQIEPLVPARVEAIRRALLAEGRLSDATLVSLLAYGGLRPGEALALRWKHIGSRSILVEQAVADGKLKPTKTGTARRVMLLDALRDDLGALRDLQDPPDDDHLLFALQAKPWSESQWRNWRRRRFQPAAAAAGISSARPYDLRHSFVSLLIYEGRKRLSRSPWNFAVAVR